MQRRAFDTLLRSIAVGLLISAGLSGSPGRAEDALKKVLILNPFVRDTEPFAAAGSAFRSALVREMGGAVDIHEVPLDLARFHGQAGEEPLVDFLENRLRVQPVDLVVPIGAAAVQFADRHRNRLFPESPIMILAAEPRMVPDGFLARNATIVTHRLEWAADCFRIRRSASPVPLWPRTSCAARAPAKSRR